MSSTAFTTATKINHGNLYYNKTHVPCGPTIVFLLSSIRRCQFIECLQKQIQRTSSVSRIRQFSLKQSRLPRVFFPRAQETPLVILNKNVRVIVNFYRTTQCCSTLQMATLQPYVLVVLDDSRSEHDTSLKSRVEFLLAKC